MVYAFLIQTLSQSSSELLYYRVYSCYGCSSRPDSAEDDTKLFSTSTEKKDLLNHVANKIRMQYCLKLRHTLLPGDNLQDTFVKGVYKERGWIESGVPVVWQGIPGLGFALICKETENTVQAHNVLDILIKQLEKHLQFISSPAIPLKLIETIALIVNHFLPSGQLLYMNSKLLRVFEKQIESDLFAK